MRIFGCLSAAHREQFTATTQTKKKIQQLTCTTFMHTLMNLKDNRTDAVLNRNNKPRTLAASTLAFTKAFIHDVFGFQTLTFNVKSTFITIPLF